MQLALYGSIGWRHPLGFGQVMNWAKEFGWDCVDARGMSIDVEAPLELRLKAFGYDMLGPRQIRKSARDQLREQLQSSTLEMLGIYCSSPVNLNGERGDQSRELCYEYLQLVADLGAKWLRPINNVASGKDDLHAEKLAYQRTIAGLKDLAIHAAKLDVGLLLENNENTVTPDAQSLLNVKAELDSICKVGIAFDAANAYFQGLDPVDGMHLLGKQIDILHLKNAKRHKSKKWDYIPRGDFAYEWTSLKDGDLDWAALIGQAAGQGFDGPLVYEYVNPFKGMPSEYWDSLSEPEVAAEEEGKYLREIVDALADR